MRILRPVVLLLTVFTGFSGLVYEVVWQKYLAILLGSHSEATAAVLGIFLAGLAAGYALFGATTRRLAVAGEASGRPPRPLLLYGCVEAAIGLYALAFPRIFALAQELSLAVPQGAPGRAFAFDVGLTALLIGPPTLLMGATIPLLSQALARSLSDATRIHAWIYGFNTVGAFAGALAAGFWLVPRLGLDGVLVAMAAVNLGAGTILALLGLRPQAGTSMHAESSPARRPAGFSTWTAAAFLLGFAMMALQTVLIRVGGLAFGASQFTFATVVAVFVLCIAIGSLAVSLLPRIGGAILLVDLAALVALLLALYPWLDEAPYWAHVLRGRFGSSEADFLRFHLAGFLGLLAAIGPAVVLSGAALPLLFHHARRETQELGATAGRLYAWNTLGSLFGALLGGYALLIWLDLHHVYRIALCALVLAGALLAQRLRPGIRVAATGSFVAAGLAALILFAPWNPRLLASGLFRYRQELPATARGAQATAQSVRRGSKLVFYDDDPTSSVAVNEWNPPSGLIRSLLINGKPEATTQNDYPTMALTGLVPALLAERAERSFVIGYGSGVTVGELASLGSMRQVVVAEISRAVLEAAPLFDFASLAASRNPKVVTVRSDAYRALLRSGGSFDVIASEPSNPWMAGIELLYSREFLAAARGRLEPGGVFAQWFHQYETDLETIELVLRTYTAIFDEVAVWYAGSADLLLLGFQARVPAPQLLERLERRAAQPDAAAGLRRAGVESISALLAHELIPPGVLHAANLPGPLHTLTHPRLSDLAARAFFRGLSAGLPFTGYGEAARIGAENSLLRRHLAAADPALQSKRRAEVAAEACVHRRTPCGAWLGNWQGREPASPALAALREAATKGIRRFGGPVDASIPGEMAALLGPTEEDADSAVPLQLAIRRTQLYQRFYQHALAFDEERLLDNWRNCQHPEDPAACARGMEYVRKLLAGERPGVPKGRAGGS